MLTKIPALAFLLFIVLLIVAADAGHMPAFIQAMHDFPHGDRVGHVGLYGILAFLLNRAYPRPVRLGRLRLPVTCFALLAFTVAEEWSQSLFPARTADFIDLACSCLGLAFGTWAADWGRVSVSRVGNRDAAVRPRPGAGLG